MLAFLLDIVLLQQEAIVALMQIVIQCLKTRAIDNLISVVSAWEFKLDPDRIFLGSKNNKIIWLSVLG